MVIIASITFPDKDTTITMIMDNPQRSHRTLGVTLPIHYPAEDFLASLYAIGVVQEIPGHLDGYTIGNVLPMYSDILADAGLNVHDHDHNSVVISTRRWSDIEKITSFSLSLRSHGIPCTEPASHVLDHDHDHDENTQRPQENPEESPVVVDIKKTLITAINRALSTDDRDVDVLTQHLGVNKDILTVLSKKSAILLPLTDIIVIADRLGINMNVSAHPREIIDVTVEISTEREHSNTVIAGLDSAREQVEHPGLISVKDITGNTDIFIRMILRPCSISFEDTVNEVIDDMIDRSGIIDMVVTGTVTMSPYWG